MLTVLGMQVDKYMRKLMHRTMLAAYKTLKVHAHFSLAKSIAKENWTKSILYEAIKAFR